MGYIGKQPTPTALIASDITDGVIGTDKLSNDAVTEAKIPDGAIENEHLNVNSITGQTAETSIADDDTVLIHDTSASALRKMTKSNFTSGLGGVADTSTAVIKGWVSFNGTGTVAITQSYNCSSITDNATGSYSANWSGATGATGSGHATCGGGDLGGYNNDERVNVYNSGNNQSGVESWSGTTATDMSKLVAITFGNGS